jgi:SAM-dependent methyltransferase
LRDAPFLIDLISSLTRQPAERVRERLRREHHGLGTNVREAMQAGGLQPHVWSDQLAAFYRETDAFLYETLVWNRTPTKNRLRRWIAEFLQRDRAIPQRILAYGDGMGFDSLYLALAGHEVTYFEVSRVCRQFAEAIFKRCGVEVTLAGSPDQIHTGAYDAVVCLDVLEHVPDPPRLVGELARMLRDQGRLIAHAPFYYIHSKVGTHLKSNRKYSGDVKRLYRPHGLEPIAGNLFWLPIVLEKHPQQPVSLPWPVRAGGWLLGSARLWSRPHTWVVLLLARWDERVCAGTQLS